MRLSVCLSRGSTLKGKDLLPFLRGKNLLPRGANSFLLDKALFSEGSLSILTELSPSKVYRFRCLVKMC